MYKRELCLIIRLVHNEGSCDALQDAYSKPPLDYTNDCVQNLWDHLTPFWNANRKAVKRAVAVVFTGRIMGDAYGCAGCGNCLCHTNEAYVFCEVTDPDWTTWRLDTDKARASLVAHELGHIIGKVGHYTTRADGSHVMEAGATKMKDDFSRQWSLIIKKNIDAIRLEEQGMNEADKCVRCGMRVG